MMPFAPSSPPARGEGILREASIEGMFLSFRKAVDFVYSSKEHNQANGLKPAPHAT